MAPGRAMARFADCSRDGRIAQSRHRRWPGSVDLLA